MFTQHAHRQSPWEFSFRRNEPGVAACWKLAFPQCTSATDQLQLLRSVLLWDVVTFLGKYASRARMCRLLRGSTVMHTIRLRHVKPVPYLFPTAWKRSRRLLCKLLNHYHVPSPFLFITILVLSASDQVNNSAGKSLNKADPILLSACHRNREIWLSWTRQDRGTGLGLSE